VLKSPGEAATHQAACGGGEKNVWYTVLSSSRYYCCIIVPDPRIRGSVPLDYPSPNQAPDPSPDPAHLFSNLHDANIKFFAYFLS
jgi:hypothetical protein